MDGQDYRVLGNNDESIIESCNRSGVEIPQSCLSGYCSTCKCKLLNGDVSMNNNLCLTENELNKGYILPCQSKPTSDRIIIVFD